MKITIEIRNSLFRRTKSTAAERGQTLTDFVTEALHDKLAASPGNVQQSDPAWMQGFGELRRLRRETARIQARVDGTFGVIESEGRE